MSIFKFRKQRKLLEEIDKEVVSVSSILGNMIKMSAVSTNGKMKIAA